ncbi:MAG: cation diffusion facilitator family transporter [Gammaproteobacteria bacterium]|nr:cation diffusion facilitator family transporter [Gammaproteobacteria bacterium]
MNNKHEKSGHDHNHDHSHNHAEHGHDHSLGGHSHAHHAPKSFNFAFAIAVSLNLGFTLIEIIFALMANSMGLLADAAHNLGDVLGLLLAWGANWLLTLPAKKRYSYGYKRTTILAAMINALILVASSAVIAYESIYKLFNVSEVNEYVVIGVALIGIFINGGTALLFMKGAEDDLNIKGAFLHLMYDALIALGVVAAGILILLTHQYWIDPVVGLLIVITILWGTWGLLQNSIRLIMDAVPHYIDSKGVGEFLMGLPDVKTLHDLHIWGLSTNEVALTAHLVISKGQPTDIDYKKINSVLKEKFRINHATIQVEMENSDYLCLRSESC